MINICQTLVPMSLYLQPFFPKKREGVEHFVGHNFAFRCIKCHLPYFNVVIAICYIWGKTYQLSSVKTMRQKTSGKTFWIGVTSLTIRITSSFYPNGEITHASIYHRAFSFMQTNRFVDLNVICKTKSYNDVSH